MSARNDFSGRFRWPRGVGGMFKSRINVALDETISAIARHSAGVTWHEGSTGLALVLTPEGYVLTGRAESQQQEMLPERALITQENGLPMREGHELTRRECESAVRTILQNTLKRRTST